MSSPAAGLSYAENNLGVNTVYEEAERLNSDSQQAHQLLLSLRDDKRNLLRSIEEREMALTVDHRSKHPDHSQAAFDRHMKIVRFEDGTLADLREKLFQLEGHISVEETNVHMTEQHLRIKVARMEELGGYLHYLGVLKQQASKPTSR